MIAHVLLDHHKEHLKSLGVEEIPQRLVIHPEDYHQAFKLWRKQFPMAAHDFIHTKVLGHAAWKEHTAKQAALNEIVPVPVAPPIIHAPAVNVQAPSPVVVPAPVIEIRFPHLELRVMVGLLLLIALLLLARPAHGQFSKISSIQTKNQGTPLASGFHASPFSVNCSTNMTCADDGSTLTLSSTGGGAATGYQTIQNAGVAIAQEVTLNWTAGITCVDNAGATRSDCALKTVAAQPHKFFNAVTSGALVPAQPASTDLSDFNTTAPTTDGQIPIWDTGSSTYIPGDPKVQGLAADGANTVLNPVIDGGYDTAGTPLIHRFTMGNTTPGASDWALEVRNIPSGTQAVSGTVTTTPPSNASTNVAQLAGTATSVNSGVKDAGTLRVVLATDQPALTNKLLVTPDSVALPANQSVNLNQVAGAATSATNPLYTRETDGTNPVILDPCRTQANIFKPISQTASAQLVTGTSAKKIYICSINLVTAGANNVAVVEGTGTVCATGIAGMAGGTTAATGWNFAANGGLTQGNGMGSIMAEATNADNLCILQSAAVQLSGSIGYVVQ